MKFSGTNSIYTPEQRSIAENLNKLKKSLPTNTSNHNFVLSGVAYGESKAFDKKIELECSIKSPIRSINLSPSSKFSNDYLETENKSPGKTDEFASEHKKKEDFVLKIETTATDTKSNSVTADKTAMSKSLPRKKK